MKILSKFNSISAFIVEKIIGVILAVDIIVVFWGVLCRYVLKLSQPWTDDVAIYTMVWAVLLGGSLGIRSKANVFVEMIINRLPIKVSRLLNVFFYLLILGFLSVIIWYGFISAYILKDAISPALRFLKMFWVYASIPAGGLLMFLQTLELMLIEFRTVFHPASLKKGEV